MIPERISVTLTLKYFRFCLVVTIATGKAVLGFGGGLKDGIAHALCGEKWIEKRQSSNLRPIIVTTGMLERESLKLIIQTL